MTKDDRLLIGLVLGLTLMWAAAGVVAAISMASAPERPCVCDDGKVAWPAGGTEKIR